MHVFYTPDIDRTQELPEEEAAHAVRVLRLQPGEEVTLTDGKGHFYRAEISIADKKHCLVRVLEKQLQAPLWKNHIHLAVAPTKNMDRMEWLAEKATEIGLDEITFGADKDNGILAWLDDIFQLLTLFFIAVGNELLPRKRLGNKLFEVRHAMQERQASL